MTIPAYDAKLDRYMGAPESQSPARYATALTKSDTVAIAVGLPGVYAKRLYVGGTGDVTIVPAGDNSAVPTPVTYSAVPAGTYLEVQARMLMSTGTTATLIVGEAD
jgi:hypothetical protein